MDELVERARNGDRDSFASLVQLTSDRMYATVDTRTIIDSIQFVDSLSEVGSPTP